jgi:hypothetical protein
VEAEFRLDWGDVVALQRHLIMWRRWLLIWAISLLMTAVCVMLSNPTPETGRKHDPLYLILGGVAASIPAWVWLVRLYNAWVGWQRVAPIAQKGNWKIGVAPDGFYFATADAQGFTKWSGIVRIDETRTHAFFFQTKYTAYILPARAFPSDVEFRTFVGLARNYKDSPPAEPPPPPGPPDAITRTTDFTS